MGLRGALVALAVVLPLAGGPAAADSIDRSGDTVTYVNSRFGTSARFPASAFPDALPAPTNGDGRAWSSPRGGQLAVYGRYRDEGEGPRSVIAARASDDTVTYKASGDSWAVVSGYRDGLIFYERYIFRGELVHSVSIRYPETQRRTYDRLVKSITESLRGASAS